MKTEIQLFHYLLLVPSENDDGMEIRMKVAVCDNLKETLAEIKEYLEQLTYIKSVELFSNIDFFFEELNTGISYDVVIMGIDWDATKNGIDYAEMIYKRSPYTKVIFMTSYTMKYVEDAILHAANMNGFWVKPVKVDLLAKTLEKIRMQNSNSDGKLVIRYKGSVNMIPLEDIVYMESRLHKVNIVLDKMVYQCNGKLEQLRDRLNEYFLQCHKSYVVNIKHIQSFRRYEIILDNGMVIPVSKKRYMEVKMYLDQFFQ